MQLPSIIETKMVSSLLLIVLLFCTCDKIIHKPSTPQLPPITTTGANTFGFLVNGELWLPTGIKGDADGYYYIWHLAPQFGGSFEIKAERDNHESSFGLEMVNRVFSTGRYPLYYKSYYPVAGADWVQFSRNDPGTGNRKNFRKINLNPDENFIDILYLDTFNYVISGTFQCKLVNEADPLDTTYITQGRFDFKYAY